TTGKHVIPYKFLRAGRVGPFSGVEWPKPGEWLRAESEPVTCRLGIHGCRTRDLPWWLADELWEIELEEPVVLDEHKLVGTSGRLRSRIDRWTVSCAQRYAEACAWRTRDSAVELLRRTRREQAADRLASCSTLAGLLATA